MNAEAISFGAMAGARRRAASYLELTKPRVVTMVLLTTLVGFYLGSAEHFNFWLAINTLIGTAMAAGGTLALNQYIERGTDARMLRTQHRPLPEGRLTPIEALWFGATLSAIGLAWLLWTTNPLAAGVTAAITLSYLFMYTPLKRVSWVCHAVGAVPGALPPVAGWAAAAGSLGKEPWLLFAIMFLWQLPHSLSIARLYGTDYARAGIKLLPAGGHRDNRVDGVILSASVALIAAGALPTVMGFAGRPAMILAAGLGAVMLFYGIRLARNPDAAVAARRVMFASLIYLPVVFLVLVIDRIH